MQPGAGEGKALDCTILRCFFLKHNSTSRQLTLVSNCPWTVSMVKYKECTFVLLTTLIGPDHI